jgi:hypothetical protein
LAEGCEVTAPRPELLDERTVSYPASLVFRLDADGNFVDVHVEMMDHEEKPMIVLLKPGIVVAVEEFRAAHIEQLRADIAGDAAFEAKRQEGA